MVRCTCAMLSPLLVLEVYKVVVVASPPVPIPCPGIFTGISRKFTLKYLYHRENTWPWNWGVILNVFKCIHILFKSMTILM